MIQLRILHRDEHLVAVDKPAGAHVHPPEDKDQRIPEHQNCLAILRRQLDRYIYPVHRIDAPTAGVVLFALDSPTASSLGALFRERRLRKTYYCVVRGWLPEEEQVIDRPLSSEADPAVKLPSVTRLRRVARIELPRAVGRYATSRYSLVRAEPETGRLHQIRRHLAGASHPIVGDTIHGDGAHNRAFRELGIPALLLKAQRLDLAHPRTGEPLSIESRWAGKWHRVFELMGACPTRFD